MPKVSYFSSLEKNFLYQTVYVLRKWTMREKEGVILMSCMCGCLYRWERAGMSKRGEEVQLVGGGIFKCEVNAEE